MPSYIISVQCCVLPVYLFWPYLLEICFPLFRPHLPWYETAAASRTDSYCFLQGWKEREGLGEVLRGQCLYQMKLAFDKCLHLSAKALEQTKECPPHNGLDLSWASPSVNSQWAFCSEQQLCLSSRVMIAWCHFRSIFFLPLWRRLVRPAQLQNTLVLHWSAVFGASVFLAHLANSCHCGQNMNRWWSGVNCVRDRAKW